MSTPSPNYRNVMVQVGWTRSNDRPPLAWLYAGPQWLAYENDGYHTWVAPLGTLAPVWPPFDRIDRVLMSGERLDALTGRNLS